MEAGGRDVDVEEISYQLKIVIKIEQEASMSKVRRYLTQVQRTFIEDERFRSLMVYYDVDPT